MVLNDLAWLDGLRARGLDVTSGALLYKTLGRVRMHDLEQAAGQLPAVREVVACKSDSEILSLIQDPAYVDRLEKQYADAGPSQGQSGFEGRIVIDVGDDPELRAALDLGPAHPFGHDLRLTGRMGVRRRARAGLEVDDGAGDAGRLRPLELTGDRGFAGKVFGRTFGGLEVRFAGDVHGIAPLWAGLEQTIMCAGSGFRARFDERVA